MSIVEQIATLVEDGRLFLVRTAQPSRAILVTKDVWRFLNGPWLDDDEIIGGNEMHATLKFIANGGRVVVGSGKHKLCHFKELTMAAPRVWEIRTRSPKPGYRLFGMFADADIFIGTNYSDRLSLRSERSSEFKSAIRASKATWRNLLGTYPPKIGVGINEYIKKDVDDER
jgi:hypothetical protein